MHSVRSPSSFFASLPLLTSLATMSRARADAAAWFPAGASSWNMEDPSNWAVSIMTGEPGRGREG